MDLQLYSFQMAHISSAIYAPAATRNLLSFQDVHSNNFHIRSTPDTHANSLQIYQETPEGIAVKETFNLFPPGIYATRITSFHTVSSQESITELWHCRLGHPGISMFSRIMKDNTGIPPNVRPSTLSWPYIACSQGKLITRPAIPKTIYNIPSFLEELNADFVVQ